MIVVGVGVDLVDVARFERVLVRRPTLAQRLFRPEELTAAQGRPERLAARFAAKEAAWKVLGVGLGATAFTDIAVVTAPTGAPQLLVEGHAANLAADIGVVTWSLSLSHTDTTAIAFVIGGHG
jgi:holo-[acyl-carrier protein] synthase